ncbi:MAG: tRNA (adenosine(37)-N6)-threonylcarbamoyltransferase complex dimerization subunit type 1 TsaB [Desulfamplus sp.]|nr:tRNA (adenosine(37)-N6)-threonylcarbamoyltransferase complex dimerization subunit type 1 TsaB [Desulfamplus sp.]
MKILAVDTAEQSCSIALVKDHVPICEEFCLSRQTHSRTLMDMIVHIVETRAGLTINDMDAFVVACGPGSFTGLRIGISIVKGLACATSKPSAGISSLDGIAFQFLASSVPVCVMMDARRGEVYSAVYNFKNGSLIQKSTEIVASPELAVEIATDSLSSRFAEMPVLFAGSGAVAFRSLIQEMTGGTAIFAPVFQNFVRASALACKFFENSDLLSMSPDAVTPVYLRKSDAEINYQRQHQCYC